MQRHSTSPAILVTFAELAWIIVFMVVFIHITQGADTQPQSAPTPDTLPPPMAKVRDLERQLAQATTQGRAQQQQLAQATTEQQALQQRLAELGARLQRAEQARDTFQRQQSDLVRREGHIRKEIIGLKGSLQRVVMLFDTSGSMRTKRSGQERWALAREVVATWIEQLPFEAIALILFNEAIHVFPEDGSLLPVQGAEGKAGRMHLMERLKRVEPSGDTNTLAALERAYHYPNIDTIILFTDGKPEVKGVPKLREKIYQLCRKHAHIPVNTVGLGHYFEPNLAAFLLQVAQETGGTFLGR